MGNSPFFQIKKEIAQARSRAADLEGTLCTLEALVERLETAVGPLLNFNPETDGLVQKRIPLSGESLPRLQKRPETLKEKVLVVLRELKGPVKPTAIIDAIVAKGWGRGSDTQLRSSIRATLSFLKRDRLVNYDQEKGYSHKEAE